MDVSVEKSVCLIVIILSIFLTRTRLQTIKYGTETSQWPEVENATGKTEGIIDEVQNVLQRFTKDNY
jgi:hypothetical protein